ncbi:putative T7SS-secreted protein [Streptomyces sp. NPDC087903]|uniref:putative T7SS-secreted protein n=1 Tax=Streptomyces sp. NPDC087903 TaxID=3365819 RepID=UPI0038169AD6
MARPKDWHPLRESDPLPGDPEGVRDQVSHMKKIAEYLRTQAAALTAMADADNLKGDYAEELAENARGLGRKLDLAEDRYREVKGHLSSWADELEEFQKQADKALSDAKDAQQVIDSRTAESDDKPESGNKEEQKKSGAAAKDDPVLERAKENLDGAHKRLRAAEGDYQERSGHFAGKIRSSIDDDMKDSWWNDLKGWVAGAEWLSTIADYASWAATIVGVVAMFFPAVGVIALVLTAVVAVIHITQAATGNGSWFDVVMDLGALKMARNGIKAAKAIKMLQQSSRKTAAGLAKDGAAARASQANQGARKTAGRAARKRGSTSRRNREAARARRLRMEGQNRTAGKRASDDVRDAEMPQITAQEKASALGDAEVGQQVKDIKKWRDAYPDNTGLADNARQAERHKDVLQGSWAVSTGLDVADKSADYATNDGYSRMKDRMTAPLPGTSQW